jgi:TIR domain
LRRPGGRLKVMTAADGGAGSGARPGRRWDVALSFAGTEREYVGQVAQALKARGIRCFYDADEKVRLWGTHLAEELPWIYTREAAAVVVFVSADYAGRDWTRLERRAAFSQAVIEAGVYVLPARFDDSELPGLLPDVGVIDLRDYTPEQFAGLVVAKLADLGTSPSLSPGEAGGAPPGGVRVSEADPRRLGVHAAISVLGVSDEAAPEYVPRDADAAEHGVRARVTTAARRGGLVLLVGGSSVGKTRCAAEAVKALLPDWWLVHPAGPGQVAALAAASSPRTVVWLDELQRYLDGEHGLTGGVMRTLLGAPHPAVIIGTLWPDRYTAYTTPPVSGGADPHAREREVLDLAAVIRIGPEFSKAEQDRARAAAARDRRLRVALESAGYGLTQTLAAAPQLVARWEDARAASPYGWAVLTAALDAARLGAAAPLTAEFLRAAAPGYCTSQQRARAPGNWFGQALAYATEELHGAAAALSPAGAGMGQIAGYTVADYLIQYATRERGFARVPASTWDAIVSHIHDPADAARLAGSAEYRLLHRYAIPLYRHAANAGDENAALQLTNLLARRGDLDGLRARADAGDGDAAHRLADQLARRGDIDGLRARADAGDRSAEIQLADLLAERGDIDGAVQILRACADGGDRAAADRLAGLLAERGDIDGAAQILRARADGGDRAAADRLAGLLAERGDIDGLRARADAGDRSAEIQLADLLAERGDIDGAAQILRARADGGDRAAADRLAGLLAERGDIDGLRARADAGDGHAARHLADLLAARGDLDGLRSRADAGDRSAAHSLAGLLAERGDIDGLRARADAGDGHAAHQLADLLFERGHIDEAVQILRAPADAGDGFAAWRLAGLLAGRGDIDGLRARADAGDGAAALRLADLLAERGDIDGAVQILRAPADAGDGDAAHQLANLLFERDDIDEAEQFLHAAADAGNLDAYIQLTKMRAWRGGQDALRARADAGDGAAADRLAGLLAGHGDSDGLLARADENDWDAARQLADLLIKQGRGEEAERLRRFGLNPDGSVACE